MVIPIVTATRWIISGERGCGKTSFCRNLFERARDAGWDVAGFLSLPRCEDNIQTGIEILDLRQGVTRLLASRRPDELAGFRYCGWTFSEAALAWGNEVFRRTTPCDLLIVDEAGPLEFEAGTGMTECFRALQSGSYRLAVAVVRPSCLQRMQKTWPECETITITSPEQSILLAGELFEAVQNCMAPPAREDSAIR